MTADEIQARALELATGDVHTKLDAIEALRELPSSPDSVALIGQALAGALGDSEMLVRAEAAEALGDPTLIPWQSGLLRLLENDEDATVRACAAEALGDAANQAGLQALKRALEDPDDSVRSYAAASLGLLGETNSLGLLRQKAASETSRRFSFLGAIARLTGAAADADELLAALRAGSEEELFRGLNVLEDLLRRKTPRPLNAARVRPLLEGLRARLSIYHQGHLAKLEKLLNSLDSRDL
jgi:HEAT repeat protein